MTSGLRETAGEGNAIRVGQRLLQQPFDAVDLQTLLDRLEFPHLILLPSEPQGLTCHLGPWLGGSNLVLYWYVSSVLRLWLSCGHG